MKNDLGLRIWCLGQVKTYWSSYFNPVQLSHCSIKTCLKWAADKTPGGDAARKWILEGNFPAVSSERMQQAAPRAPDKCLGSLFFRVHGESLRRTERLMERWSQRPSVGTSCCQNPTLSCTWGQAWREIESWVRFAVTSVYSHAASLSGQYLMASFTKDSSNALKLSRKNSTVHSACCSYILTTMLLILKQYDLEWMSLTRQLFI